MDDNKLENTIEDIFGEAEDAQKAGSGAPAEETAAEETPVTESAEESTEIAEAERKAAEAAAKAAAEENVAEDAAELAPEASTEPAAPTVGPENAAEPAREPEPQAAADPAAEQPAPAPAKQKKPRPTKEKKEMSETTKTVLKVLGLVAAICFLAAIVFLFLKGMADSTARSEEKVVTEKELAQQAEAERVAAEKAAAKEAEEKAEKEAAELAAKEAEEKAAAEAAAEEAARQAAEEAAKNAVYVIGHDVNIRSGPGTENDSLGKAQQRTPYTKTGESGDWTEIDYNGTPGYVKSEYISVEVPDWDLDELDNDRVNFGYSRDNRDENNVPTDWEYYEKHWGEFNADWIQDTSVNTIYLTMDEGYANDNTSTILDILKEKNVTATFFLTKDFVDKCPELVQRMIDEGHQLGNHTCSHPIMPKKSISRQKEEIQKLHDLVKEQFGYEMKLFRFPEGTFSRRSLGLVNNLGYKAVFWSFAYEDYDEDDQPDVEESLLLTLDSLHNGAIYLLHANSDTNTALLGSFIDGARARGFEFGVYPRD